MKKVLSFSASLVFATASFGAGTVAQATSLADEPEIVHYTDSITPDEIKAIRGAAQQILDQCAGLSEIWDHMDSKTLYSRKGTGSGAWGQSGLKNRGWDASVGLQFTFSQGDNVGPEYIMLGQGEKGGFEIQGPNALKACGFAPNEYKMFIGPMPVQIF